MSKPKKKRAPSLDPRLLARPRLDAVIDRVARGELDADGLRAGLQALIAETGPRPALDALLQRLATAPDAERDATLAGASGLRSPEAIAHLWQQVRNAGLSTEVRAAGLELLHAMGEDADADHPERYLLEPPASPTPTRKPLPGFPIPLDAPEPPAADEAWEAFSAADLHGKITLFESALAAGEMDDDEAFEMLNAIRGEMKPRDHAAERARYAALVERLRREAPRAYEESAAYYLENLIADAAADGRWDALPSRLDELVPTADARPDVFSRVIDSLMYHGQTRPLVNAMRAAWPAVSRSHNVLPWAIDEFHNQLLRLIFFEYLDTTPEPRADDPALLEAARPFGEFRPEWIELAVRHFAAPSPWTPADFGEAVDAETWERNVSALLWEFAADQRHAGVPLAKTELAGPQWYEALHQQMTAQGTARAKGRSKSKKKGATAAGGAAASSPLVPRKALLDKAGASLLDFLSPEPYKVGATFELLPAYLHFIARRGLLARPDLEAALTALRPLTVHVQTALEQLVEDPHPIDALVSAWSEDRLAGLVRDPAAPDEVAAPPPPSPPAKPLPGRRLTYTFKVSYDRQPDVWRTLELTATQTLADLHAAIQHAFEFDFDHLYSFFMSGRAWDKPSEYAARPEAGERGVNLPIGELTLRPRQKFLYLFDYGDEHHFTVQLVGTNPDAPKGRYPRMVESHGDAPPQYPSWEDEAEDDEWDDEDLEVDEDEEDDA